MKVYRDIVDSNGKITKTPIFNIMEGTYSGKDMGERSISATIEFPTPIDFRAGDYVEFDIADLIRGENVEGGHFLEKFYIYTMPTIKKIASSMSIGNAFEHTVTFHPRQYELVCVQMRDVLQQVNNGVIYTGYDEFSFYGGAKALIDRIIAVLDERFPKSAKGVAGVDYWDYRISDSVNEERNTALEKFQFNFSGNSVMDAILKLNDKDGVNTKFWINERMIYIGFKRPYVCGVDSANVLRTTPFDFKYGKTSHLPISVNYGNIFTITKSLGNNSPITRLYAYGADRNLHRFYCSDRIKSGRYVNHLMLPSFGNDGKTDYIDSVEGIAKFGIREGSKTFEEIYPSLRYSTYGDLRSIKYCIKIMGSGIEPDSGKYEEGATYKYPIARVQCYKVELLEGTKVNHLVPSAPPVDLAVFCHATGKTVKVILYADKDGKSALQRQQEAAGKWNNGNYRVPTRTLHGTDYIAGAAFAIHDENYGCQHIHDKYIGTIGAKRQYDSGKLLTRDDWFVNADEIDIYDGENKIINPAKEKYKNEVSIHQIHYTDTHWITDIFEFTSYDQTNFQRQGYSAYCWSRINNTYPESASDNIEVNQIVDIPNIVIEDTDLNATDGSNQQYFEIFTRDMGFKINEQTWFGDYVFLFGNCTVSFLDGNLGGYNFTCPKENDSKKIPDIYIPALLEDGSENELFFKGDKYVSSIQCRKAYEQGAYWRILLQRSDTDIANYWMPNININGNAGDHFVFLDIFMPDIYQRIAERRLEKEARKYLDANDDGDIQYSFDFDKVRMMQIPSFGLQMREGAIMRVIDDDLDIKTTNSSRIVFFQNSGLVSGKSLIRTEFDSIDTETTEYFTSEHRDMEYIKNMYPDKVHGLYGYSDKYIKLLVSGGENNYFTLHISNEDAYSNAELYFPNNIVRVRLSDRTLPSVQTGGTIYYGPFRFVDDDKSAKYIELFVDKYEKINDTDWNVYYHVGYGVYNSYAYYGWAEYNMRTKHTVTTSTANHKSYILPQGSRFFCPSKNLTEFKANKYYEVTMDCENTTMPFFDKNGMRTLFALLNNLGDYASWFVPEYTAEEIMDFDGSDKWRRFVFKFTLEETFNDNQDYYPAIQYISDGKTEKVNVRLVSIIEADAGGLKDLKYTDLNIDTITIKFHDNTREHGVSLQNGVEPSRIIEGDISPMIREISATVKEESRASSWAQMMSRIEDNEILGDQIIRVQEQIANAARRRYRELLSLRDSIFDPDGTCDQTFLHIMMLQIGADSMNYQLDKTHQSANGNVLSNCRIDQIENNNDQFKILSDDILRHYVFTEDEPQGLWYIPKPDSEFDLAQIADDDGILYYPTYFVAIKCAIHNSRNAMWVCEPTQHKTNEDDEYYYFNWGILTPIDGHYILKETRGNAYMYGDNLICGKISTLAGQSYFDLTHGDFVLSNGVSKALSYENGILTIGGVNDDSVDSILARLGITEGVASSAQSSADKANEAAQSAQAEAQKVRGEFQTAIANQESAMNTALAGVQESLGSLQNQIDGEVTAWFLKGVPTLDNQPAADWKVYNADGSLDKEATNAEYQRHEGDTYTNMSSYEEDGENAGKSWRWCKGTSDSPATTWHWHLIADSDAVKALVEAGKAQATADGKSTTFVKQPTNYQVGDLWILQTDSDHPAGKKGDILTANQHSTAYNASHWSKNVKYTDDTAANAAKQAADNAKKVADAAQADATKALTNLADINQDGRVYISEMKSLAVELENIKQEKIQLVGKDGKGGEAQKWDASVNQNAYITAYDACVKALTYYTTESNAQNGYITIITDTNNQYSWNKITQYYSARQVLVNAIADATNNYSDSIKTTADKAVTDAANAKSAADEAKSVADAATTRLDSWAADGVISPAEKQGIKDEIARIDADKSHISNEYTKYGLGTPTVFNTAHTNYRAVLVTLSAAKPENITIPNDFATKQTAYYTARTSALNAISAKADDVSNAYADKVSTDAAKAAIDNLQIGGRNLLKNSSLRGSNELLKPQNSGKLTITDDALEVRGSNPIDGIGLKDVLPIPLNEEFTISFDIASSNAERIEVRAVNQPTGWNGISRFINIENDGNYKRYHATFPSLGGLCRYFYILLNTTTEYTQLLKIRDIKLEKGNKATDWTPAPEDVEAGIEGAKQAAETARLKAEALNYLKAALQDGSTDIAGGLLMTCVLMLKDLNGNVTAGMSGLTQDDKGEKDNVLLWGGGSYFDAFNAALPNSDYKKLNGSPITTLLKKDGTGKIGIFKVSEKDVVVDNNGVRTIITTDSIKNFADANNIGYKYYNQTFKSSAQTSQARVLMKRIFDGKQTGTVKIDDLFISVGIFGTDDLSQSTAKLKISVGYNNTTSIIKQEEIYVTKYGHSGSTTISLFNFSKTYQKIQSFTIELESGSTTIYGSITARFNCYAGTAGNSKTCVIANDGIMLSSGGGERFIVSPTDSSMSVIADLPIISTKDDVNKLTIGQLFTDSSGIVRRYSLEDETHSSNQIKQFVSVFYLKHGSLKRDILDFSQFIITKTNDITAMGNATFSGNVTMTGLANSYKNASKNGLYEYGNYDIRHKRK